eukprot:5478251-Prymnesium_polylepis.1
MVDAATSMMKSGVMQDASCTAAAFVPATRGPAAQLVLKVGNLCGKYKSCQATPSVRSACVGTHVRRDCEAELAPQLQRAVAAAERAEHRIGAQLRDGELARSAHAERRARDAAAAAADRAAAIADREAAQSLHDEMTSLREAGAAVEKEVATAEREFQRAQEQ